MMFSFTGGVVSTEVEKRRWDEDGFLVSLKSIRCLLVAMSFGYFSLGLEWGLCILLRKLLVPGTPDEEHLR